MSPVRRPVALGTVALLVLGGLSAAVATPDPPASSEVVGGPVVLAVRPQPVLPRPAARRHPAEASTAPTPAVVSPADPPAVAPVASPAVAPAVVRPAASVQIAVVEAVGRAATDPIRTSAPERTGAVAVQASSPRHVTAKNSSAGADRRVWLDARIEARVEVEARADEDQLPVVAALLPVVAALSAETTKPSVDPQGRSLETQLDVAVEHAVVTSTQTRQPSQVAVHVPVEPSRSVASSTARHAASDKHASAKKSAVTSSSGRHESGKHRSEAHGPRGR